MCLERILEYWQVIKIGKCSPIEATDSSRTECREFRRQPWPRRPWTDSWYLPRKRRLSWKCRVPDPAFARYSPCACQNHPSWPPASAQIFRVSKCPDVLARTVLISIQFQQSRHITSRVINGSIFSNFIFFTSPSMLRLPLEV